MERFKRWLCSKIGHAFESIDVLMFEIGIAAIHSPTRTLKCKRCKEVVRTVREHWS